MDDSWLISQTLYTAIQQEYPNISGADINGFIAGLEDEIGRRMLDGELLAFVKPLPDGSYELTVFDFDNVQTALKGE